MGTPRRGFTPKNSQTNPYSIDRLFRADAPSTLRYPCRVKLIVILLGFIPLLLPPLFGIGIAGTQTQALFFERYLSLVLLFGLWSLLLTLSERYLRGVSEGEITLRKIGGETQRKITLGLGKNRQERIISGVILVVVMLLAAIVAGFLRKLSHLLQSDIFSLVLATLALGAFVRLLMQKLQPFTGWLACSFYLTIQTVLAFYTLIDQFSWQIALLGAGFAFVLAPAWLSYALLKGAERDSTAFRPGIEGRQASMIFGSSVLIGLILLGLLPVLHQLAGRYILLLCPVYLVPTMSGELNSAMGETAVGKTIDHLYLAACYAMAVPAAVSILIALLGLF